MNFFQILASIAIALVKDCFSLDILLIPKISKCQFFRDIQNSFYEVADLGLEPHQKIFFEKLSTNMVTRGVGSFPTLGGIADLLIEYCQKIFCQSRTYDKHLLKIS